MPPTMSLRDWTKKSSAFFLFLLEMRKIEMIKKSKNSMVKQNDFYFIFFEPVVELNSSK